MLNKSEARKNRNPIICQNYSMRNLSEYYSRVGILTDCPSTTPLGFALGPPNPWLITIAKETLDFRWEGLSPSLRLLRPTFSLPNTPPLFTRRLQCIRNASLPLAPRYCSSPLLPIYKYLLIYEYQKLVYS